MKKSFFNLVILTCLFFSCQNDERLETDLDDRLEVQGKGAVIKSGDLTNLRLKDVPGTLIVDEATPHGQVRVEAKGELYDWIEVKREGGELRITGKNNLPTSLDLNFFIHPDDIRKIVVEGKNVLEIVSTPVLEYLELVTEGESQLFIYNLKVENLVSRREGKSRMFLSSLVTETEFDRENLNFAANTVDILEGYYIMYNEDGRDYMIIAPDFEIRDDIVYIRGNATSDPINVYYITQTHELRNEGESFLDALELPTKSITSKNEGKSEARVWPIHHLNVRGEGESSMVYIGDPIIHHQLEGSSRLTDF